MNAINTDKKVQLTYGGLKSSTDTSGADYTIIGIPFDIRTTYRPGTRFGPDGIRRAFSTDSVNEAVGIDTSKYVKGVDYGDLDMWNAEKAYLGSIPQEMKAILETGTIPIVLGGDHSITFPELLAYKDVYGPVSIIHFDSHTDTWGSDTDKEHHDHSTPFRRAIEYDCIDPKTSIQVGMRGGLFDESDFDFAMMQALSISMLLIYIIWALRKPLNLFVKRSEIIRSWSRLTLILLILLLLPVQALPFPVDLLQDKLLNLFVMRLSVLILLALTLLKSHRTMTQGE